jgi:hypothetical protein
LDRKRKKFFKRWAFKGHFYYFKEVENRLESLTQEEKRERRRGIRKLSIIIYVFESWIYANFLLPGFGFAEIVRI